MNVQEQNIDNQMRALTEVFVIYKYEVTPFEANLWKAVMAAVPESSFMAFLSHHVRSSSFAPKLADVERVFHPSGQNKDVAFEQLRSMVKQYGPYQVPEVTDPAMLSAIAALGGWVVVNEEMPASNESYLVKQYKDRFDAVYQFADVSARVRGLPAPSDALAIAVQKPMEPIKGRLSIESTPTPGMRP